MAIAFRVACLAVTYFSTLSDNRHYFLKQSYWTQNVFWFPLQFLSETFLVPRNIQRDTIKMYIGLHVKWPLFFLHFNQTWTSRRIFEKHSNIKFQENPSSGSRVLPCGRTDRRDEANSRFSQFCERV
jgi:hypothetical protein